MTSVRALALAAALTTASAVAANAQAGWPNSPPQGQSAWPSSSPQPHPQAQAAWPNSAPPAQPPQQAPWPASAPPGQPMATPPMGGPVMGGGMGGGPTPEQQECIKQFVALRTEVEKRGNAAKLVSEKQPTREDMCKAVTAIAVAHLKWVKFVEANLAKCGIPKDVATQLRAGYTKTVDGQKKLCAAGPAGGPAAAPTLSDALGTATLPTREPEKQRKPGGTLDTLTGNALTR